MVKSWGRTQLWETAQQPGPGVPDPPQEIVLIRKESGRSARLRRPPLVSCFYISLDAGPFHCYNRLIVLICPFRRDYCYAL
jgi:hypothetical protein